jgi:hypothetical protein
MQGNALWNLTEHEKATLLLRQLTREKIMARVKRDRDLDPRFIEQDIVARRRALPHLNQESFHDVEVYQHYSPERQPVKGLEKEEYDGTQAGYNASPVWQALDGYQTKTVPTLLSKKSRRIANGPNPDFLAD